MAGNTPQKGFINNLTEGNVTRQLLVFAIPLFFSNLLQAAYSMVDMAVVGQVVGESGLSGLSIGSDVLSFLTFLSMGFSNAGQIIIAQYVGAGKREKLSRFIGTMFSFLLLCALIMSVACLLLRGQILSWMNTPEQSWEQAMAYSMTCYFGLIFIYGYNIVSAVMRGMGDSRRPFMFVAIAAVLNLVLDLVFVAGFGMEAFGAALATVIAQGVSFLTALIYLYRNRDRFGFRFSLRSFIINAEELVMLVKLGVPMAFRSATVLFSKLFINSWINSYGVTVSAVYGIGIKLDSIGNLLGGAVTTAGSSMVAQNIGAEKYDRVGKVLRSAFLLCGIFFAVVILILVIFPKALFGMFTSDPQLLEACMEYLPISVIAFVACAVRDSINAFVYGCGNFKFNFALAILDGVVARIGLSLLLGLAVGLGYYGFWLGGAFAGFMPFVAGTVYYMTGWWKKSSLIRKKQ